MTSSLSSSSAEFFEIYLKRTEKRAVSAPELINRKGGGGGGGGSTKSKGNGPAESSGKKQDNINDDNANANNDNNRPWEMHTVPGDGDCFYRCFL
jgi:hypothetical protein